MRNKDDKLETVELGTFADNDDQFCRVFTVPKDWLIDILERLDGFNEQYGVDLENFLDNYCWDETWFIYKQAKCQGCLLKEWIDL